MVTLRKELPLAPPSAKKEASGFSLVRAKAFECKTSSKKFCLKDSLQ
jgi:hypothetical protein